MELSRKLLACMTPAAEGVTVHQIIIGLSYTAVTLFNGDVGIAATGIAQAASCAGSWDVPDCEDRPASDLLVHITASDPMTRTMALALVNALNHRHVRQLPEDDGNRMLLDRFAILSGARVAMVGYFPPLVRLLESHQVPMTIIDDTRGLGDKAAFKRQLHDWADVLLITATSIINNTTEAILSHAGPELKTILLGPSTPMVPEAFDHLPIHMLAGTAIVDPEGSLKTIRHGGGARALKPHGRKVYQLTEIGRRISRCRHKPSPSQNA
jgi:uncharacterized protein (DUF4213/DUF364 family)